MVFQRFIDVFISCFLSLSRKFPMETSTGNHELQDVDGEKDEAQMQKVTGSKAGPRGWHVGSVG